MTSPATLNGAEATDPHTVTTESGETVDLTPWKDQMRWWAACRPNFDLFDSDATDAQRSFLAAHNLTFTEDSSDYEIREGLLGKLRKLINTDDVDVVEELIEVVESALCPIDCTTCAEDELAWLFEQLTDAAAEYTKAFPDVLWVVTDWRGDSVTIDELPDPEAMTERYLKRISVGYSELTVELHPDDAFARVSFDRQEFTVHALTSQTDTDLVEHAAENTYFEEPVDLEPFLAASGELRALMVELYQDHGSVSLPRKIWVSRGGRPAVIEEPSGTLDGADLAVLAAVAEPLLPLPPAARESALGCLEFNTGNWPELVAALAACAA